MRVAAAGWGVGAGRAVAARSGSTRTLGAVAGGPAAGPAGGAGGVRDGRQPCAGAALEAGGEQVARRRGVRSPGSRGARRGRAATGRWTCCLEVEDELDEQVFFATADLLNLEVDVMFFDTTSTYFESDDARRGRPSTRTGGDRARRSGSTGTRKDHRPDLPQVVIGLAVTREGIPVRVLVLAGQQHRSGADPAGQGRPARLEARPGGVGRRPRLSVGGEPPLPAARRRALHRRREAPRQRQGSQARRSRARAATRRRRATCASRRSCVDDGTMRDRFVICHNPDEAERDQAVREQLHRPARATRSPAATGSRGRRARRRSPARSQTKRGLQALPPPDQERPAPDRPRRGHRRGAPRRQVPRSRPPTRP